MLFSQRHLTKRITLCAQGLPWYWIIMLCAIISRNQIVSKHTCCSSYFCHNHYVYMYNDPHYHFTVLLIPVLQWETNFLSRLQKHRFSELNKYEDDYYGEKVMTLSDYRQWVRQQHRKRERVAKAQNSQLGEGEKLQASWYQKRYSIHVTS